MRWERKGCKDWSYGLCVAMLSAGWLQGKSGTLKFRQNDFCKDSIPLDVHNSGSMFLMKILSCPLDVKVADRLLRRSTCRLWTRREEKHYTIMPCPNCLCKVSMGLEPHPTVHLYNVLQSPLCWLLTVNTLLSLKQQWGGLPATVWSSRKDPCVDKWYGVSCDNSTTQRVISL